MEPGGSLPTDGHVRIRHVPALDGMRAFAVLAVIGFHSVVAWLQGGYYGVDAFFVLSGFLITSILVAEWTSSGTISLPGFWGRRARRLLPAPFLMLAVVGIVAAIRPTVLGSPGLFGDTISTVFYVANWHLIAAHDTYFSA